VGIWRAFDAGDQAFHEGWALRCIADVDTIGKVLLQKLDVLADMLHVTLR
jgi:hypothetical protein